MALLFSEKYWAYITFAIISPMDCCGILRLSGGVRVGSEVTQHGRNGLHIHAILQRCCREFMPEFMKFQVWESRIL